MRSTAHVKSHPIHPALIPFPFAFLTGALLFDAAGIIVDEPRLWITGGHLAVVGLLAGLVAAVPGIIDYVYAVPPRSSGRRRARTHGIVNVIALLLFAAGWWLREPDGSPSLATLGAELLGGIALAYAAWLGGTLVTRNLISVDHRYADAGKWQEERYTAVEGRPLPVGRVNQLGRDQMKLLRVNGRRIVLARTAKGYAAFDDSCSHRGGSLAGGVCVGGTVQCLWHGSQFDTATGTVECGPAKKNINVYEVREEAGQVLLVPDASFFSRSAK